MQHGRHAVFEADQTSSHTIGPRRWSDLLSALSQKRTFTRCKYDKSRVQTSSTRRRSSYSACVISPRAKRSLNIERVIAAAAMSSTHHEPHHSDA